MNNKRQLTLEKVAQSGALAIIEQMREDLEGVNNELLRVQDLLMDCLEILAVIHEVVKRDQPDEDGNAFCKMLRDVLEKAEATHLIT